jgi:citrate lyase subunit beta/citryl-CoA lyase
MRSKLFVPGSRPELFAKALKSAADALSFDLEDAVEEAAKPAARAHLSALLQGPIGVLGDKLIVVRVNAVDTSHFAADLEAVVWRTLHVVNLPMVECPDVVRQAAQALAALEKARGLTRPVRLLVNIESPRGLRRAAELACADPRVMGLQIGYGDLFSPLGIASGEPSATQFVRVAVRLAAGEAGIDAYDGAFVNFSDPAGYRSDSDLSQRLGFAGRSCIHPSQVALANEVFRPSEADIAHSVRVVEAARDNLARGVGAFTVDGRLVDGPFITRAENVVKLASRLGLVAG